MAQIDGDKSRVRRQWLLTGIVAASAVAVISAVSWTVPREPNARASAAMQVTASDRKCDVDVRSTSTGPAEFNVRNVSQWPQEVYLVKLPDMGSLARTITLGPGTAVTLGAILGPGQYGFQCLQSGQLAASSASFEATGPSPANVTPAVAQASTGELQPANGLYLKYVQHELAALQGQVAGLQRSLSSGDAAGAKASLLAAQQSWAGVGAAYGSFGDLGNAIDGPPDASKDPATDPGFTGLRRIEFGLYHAERPQLLAPLAAKIQADVAELTGKTPQLLLGNGTLGLRAHEILEDTLRDRLSGQDDQGSGMAFALAQADVEATRTVVSDLSTALEKRSPGLLASINADLDVVAKQLESMHANGTWKRFQDASLEQRQPINAAVSAALERLALIPQLLVLPQGSE